MDTKKVDSVKKEIKERLDAFRENVNTCLKKSGRGANDLVVIGVSKFFPAEYARAAYELGLTDLGENRVSELLEKKETLEEEGIRPKWHFIGTLQTNKVKKLIGNAELIHSVDSMHLLKEISVRSEAAEIHSSVLLQVNISKEETKHGFSEHEISKAIWAANECPYIRLCGLMTMAPAEPSFFAPRKVFEGLRVLFEKMKSDVSDADDWKVLSMGMSSDYEEAIACGATHIRVGTSIFGPRYS